jgi:spore maturation protein A
MIVVGCVTAIATGRVDIMMTEVIDGAQEAVELMIGLAGVFCLWTGVEKLAEKSGLVDALARAFNPVFGLMFPHLRNNPKPLVP